MNPGSEYKEIMLPAFAFLTFDQTSILRRLFPSHIIFPAEPQIIIQITMLF